MTRRRRWRRLYRAHYHETIRHKSWALYYVGRFCFHMLLRAIRHDMSKFSHIETHGFALNRHRMRRFKFSSEGPSSTTNREVLGAALYHHYAINRHHPEHYENGIRDMDLKDFCMMFFDWMAATHGNLQGHIIVSIEQNQKRFSLSDDLIAILKNEAKEFRQ